MKILEMITIMADSLVDEIAILLTEHDSGGRPVVDDKNQVIDMVTGSDLILKEKGMPFSLFRIPRLFRCWADSVQHIAKRNLKRVPALDEEVLARREA